MRLLKRIERSFVSHLVATTRKLISAEKPIHEKIALLQFSAADHFGRAERLRDELEELSTSTEKRERLLDIIALREKAGSYLWATAKFLQHHESYEYSLARMPRLFAKPNWGYSREKAVIPERLEIQFMDFSS